MCFPLFSLFNSKSVFEKAMEYMTDSHIKNAHMVKLFKSYFHVTNYYFNFASVVSLKLFKVLYDN